jgi:O-acetyl-ADP-ribose deacetylase
MNIKTIIGNITELHIDAIVNSANIGLKGGAGVCGAIHDAAGSGLEEECARIGSCQRGEAVITKGYNLPARYVIHTVAPIYGQHHGNEPEILFSCYYESLRLAEAHQVTSIAFPAIGTGIYKYPASEATEVARDAISAYIEDNPKPNIKEVLLVTYGG